MSYSRNKVDAGKEPVSFSHPQTPAPWFQSEKEPGHSRTPTPPSYYFIPEKTEAQVIFS